MPIVALDDTIIFPPPEFAEESGLLAVGGDLRPERLLKAYSMGIFPWYSEGDPLLWWFTSPRLVLFPHEFRIPKRLGRYARSTDYEIRISHDFRQVIDQCAKTREVNGIETWIMPEMRLAYTLLNELGFAHSVECWQDGELAGGLYGISLDQVFFGESMFSQKKCASQFALIALVEHMRDNGMQMIDCQMTTNHLLRFGAREIEGQEFQKKLRLYIKSISPQYHWNYDKRKIR